MILLTYFLFAALEFAVCVWLMFYDEDARPFANDPAAWIACVVTALAWPLVAVLWVARMLRRAVAEW